jgi:proline iminopeptidase
MLRLEVSVCVDGGTKISGVLVPKENFYVENISSPPDKTGKERTTPLLYLEDSGNYAIVASNGGDPKSPAWLLNLETNPEAAIEVGSKKLCVRVEEAEGEEKRRLWRRLVAMYPSYESYQRRTDREIPIVVLRPAKDNEPK